MDIDFAKIYCFLKRYSKDIVETKISNESFIENNKNLIDELKNYNISKIESIDAKTLNDFHNDLLIYWNKNKSWQKIATHKLYSNAPQSEDSLLMVASYIKRAVDEPLNKNIGLIGAYGSGKSSAICTFEDLNSISDKKYKITKVSMGTFESNDNDLIINNKDENDYFKICLEKRKNLELNIIQQLIFSVGKKDLFNSSIKRIDSPGKRPTFFLVSIALFILTTVLLIMCPLIEQMKFFTPYASVFEGAALILLLFLLFKFYPPRTIKVGAKDVQIESTISSTTSIFDNFMDELINFFIKTKTDIVVFEDIDRSNDELLFSELHNLNFLLNNYEPFKKEKRKIIFIYSVKEDMFISSEQKSKFFDCLISVPPIFTSNNALENVSLMFSNAGISLGTSSGFLEKISRHIDYYRQLKNIINSYYIYSDINKNIENNSFEKEQLLVILLYKSLFPKDYKQFLLQKGVLWSYIYKDSKNKTELRDNVASPKSDSKDDTEEGADDKKIKCFYETFKMYLNESAITIVSSFISNNELPTIECRLLRDAILFQDNDYVDFKYVYPNIDHLISVENDIPELYELKCFLNFSIVDFLIKENGVRLTNFCNSFKSQDPVRTQFLNEYIKQSENKESLNILLSAIVKECPFMFKEFCDNQQIAKKGISFSSLFKLCIHNFDDYVAINSINGYLDKSLLALNQAWLILDDYNEEFWALLFERDEFRIQVLFKPILKSKFVNWVLNAGFFKSTIENFMSIGYAIAENDGYMKRPFSTLYYFDEKHSLFIKFAKFCEKADFINFKDLQFYDEDQIVLNQIWKTYNFGEELRNKIMEQTINIYNETIPFKYGKEMLKHNYKVDFSFLASLYPSFAEEDKNLILNILEKDIYSSKINIPNEFSNPSKKLFISLYNRINDYESLLNFFINKIGHISLPYEPSSDDEHTLCLVKHKCLIFSNSLFIWFCERDKYFDSFCSLYLNEIIEKLNELYPYCNAHELSFIISNIKVKEHYDLVSNVLRKNILIFVRDDNYHKFLVEYLLKIDPINDLRDDIFRVLISSHNVNLYLRYLLMSHYHIERSSLLYKYLDLSLTNLTKRNKYKIDLNKKYFEFFHLCIKYFQERFPKINIHKIKEDRNYFHIYISFKDN